MLVVGALAIVEDGVRRGQVAGVRIQSGCDFLALDRDHAAVVACRSAPVAADVGVL